LPVSLSVVVVAHDMDRELPRTLESLSSGRQRQLPAEYEIVVVDNGSARPVDVGWLDATHAGPVVGVRIDDAPSSPAHAANEGVRRASGDLVGLIVDGARLASPGLLATAYRASALAPWPVVASLGWHLGPTRHMQAREEGYDQATEDRLLAETNWEADGYALFEISTLAASSARGWFGPIGESSALFMPTALWEELGWLDERFDLPGGGLVNHDLFRRACEHPETELVVLLGEGTFHQYHGGAATSGRLSWDEMHAQYEHLRGRAYEPPTMPRLYAGPVPSEALPHLAESVRLAQARAARTR
jgi:hypothetical protein